VTEDGSIELHSSAFLDELGPPSLSSKERAASLVGTLISGRYRVDEIAGQGGMGAVFRGEQIHLRKRVAIKVLHPDTERLPGLVDRFEREAVAGAHVQHPNVAAAIDFGKLDDGSYFLVLEYVEGSCPARRALLDRAAAEGDRRTLVQLEAAHGARCSNKKDPCCFREDPAMAGAITRLRGRLDP